MQIGKHRTAKFANITDSVYSTDEEYMLTQIGDQWQCSKPQVAHGQHRLL